MPALAWQLAEAVRERGYAPPSLDSVTYGGAPAVGSLGASLTKVVPATGWGMTETSATATHHQGEDYIAHPDSCGPPLPVGGDLSADEVGELCVRGPNIVRGYWDDPDAPAETFRDGWLHTGDLARRDEEGFLTIVDRMKDMLIRGGENIHCLEVENALFTHPDVIDAVVLPVPHPTLGEEPGAIVALVPGSTASADTLRAFAGRRLVAFKVPVEIRIWDGMLRRNAAGKILRRDLRQVFASAGRSPRDP